MINGHKSLKRRCGFSITLLWFIYYTCGHMTMGDTNNFTLLWFTFLLYSSSKVTHYCMSISVSKLKGGDNKCDLIDPGTNHTLQECIYVFFLEENITLKIPKVKIWLHYTHNIKFSALLTHIVDHKI